MAKNNIEKEVRYFYPAQQLSKVHDLIINSGAEFQGRFYELTVMYDNPNEAFSFYPLEVDGRLRFRTSIYSPLQNQEDVPHAENSSKITWKRRLPKDEDSKIHKEEEIEVRINHEDYQNMQNIFEKVLKCKRMSSYERYRNLYEFEGLSITIDEFPYGIMLEVEIDDAPDTVLHSYIESLGLSAEESYPLSCDDKYVELCKEDCYTVKDDILFEDDEMPQITK